MGLLRLALILLILGSCATYGQQVMRQHRGPNYLWQEVRLADKQMDVNMVRAQALSFADQHPDIPILQMRFCTVESHCYAPVFASHVGHWYYRLGHEFGVSHPRQSALAEAIFVRGAGILRVRDEVGRVYSELLGKADPLQIETPRESARIVWLQYHSPVFEKTAEGTADAWLCVYLTSRSTYTQEFADEVLAELQRRFAPERTSLEVWIRPKPWFAHTTGGGFPVFYPFDPSFTLPTEDEVKTWPSVVCDGIGNDWVTRCRVFALQ